MPDLHGWTMTPWACVCGRVHAAWWCTTPPPSCPHGWPKDTAPESTPFTAETVESMFAGPLPWPSKEHRNA